MRDEVIEEDAYLVSNIESILKKYDKIILAQSFLTDLECELQLNKIIDTMVLKRKIIKKYNGILDAIETFTPEQRLIYNLYYIDKQESIVCCGVLNISQRTFFRKLNLLKEKYANYFKFKNYFELKKGNLMCQKV